MTQISLGEELPSANNTFLDEEDESHKCRRCNLSISEGHAYELGGDRWHMYCFSCSKCSKLLGTSSNFLVLGTGDLICSECSYACNACGKKIDDLAILTGDQAYCSSCFCCRNCKKRIEDLRYARTSKGLFCMSCHEKLLEKKKRHEQDKKTRGKRSSGGISTSNRSSIRSSKYAHMDKSLPKIPPTNTPGSGSTSHNVSIASDEGSSEVSTPDVLDVPTAVAATSVIPPRSPKRKAVPLSKESQPLQPFSPQDQDQNPVSTLDPPITVKSQSPPVRMRSPSIPDQSYFDNHDSLSKSVANTTPSQQLNSPPTSLHNTPDLRNELNSQVTPRKLQPLSDGTPLKQAIISPNGKNRQAVVLDSISSSSSNNILSSYINESPPPKVPPPELPVAGDDFIDMNDSSDDDHISRYAQNAQGFQESRQSDRVPSGLNIRNVPELNETNNEFSDDIRSTEDFQSFQNTLQESFDDTTSTRDQQQSQPLQYQVPNTPRSWKFGLGSSRNDNSNNVVGGSTLLSPTSPSPMNNSKKSALTNITNEPGASVSRNKSMKSPKSFLSFRKHKKSASGSSLEPTPGSSTSHKGKYHSPLIEPSSKFDSLQTPKFNSHARGKSDSSPYQGAALFTTPPIPENRLHHHHSQSQQAYPNSLPRSNTTHYRSASDAITYQNNNPDDLTGFELELRSLKTEIFDLKQAKSGLRLEVNELTSQRDQLNLEVLQLNSKMEKLKIEFDERQKQYEEQQRQFQELYQQQQQQQHHHHHQQQQQQQQHNHQHPQHQLQPQPVQKSNSQNDAHQSSDKFNGDSPVVTVLSPQQDQFNEAPQPKTKGRFWRRNNVTKGIGNVFNKSEGMSTSQSSYSLSHLLAENKGGSASSNSNGNIRGGNPTISAPLLRNEELDELGGNDNKKLINGSKSNNYLEAGTSSSNSMKSNNSNPAFIMSDLFNSTLEMRTLFEKRPVPLIVSRLIAEVESRGLDSEGIYRKNGGTLQMNNILKAFNNLLTADTSQELEGSLEGDINAVTSSLKKYLYHHLPEPIISMNSYDSFIQVSSAETPDDKIEQLTSVLNQLPKANLKTLSSLLTHIKKIESYSNVNKMTFHNLAVVFAPTFTRVSSGERELADMQPRNTVTEFLLINQDDILKNVNVN